MVYAVVSNASDEVSDVRRQTDLATAVTGPQGVLSSIQDERNWTVVEMIGMEETISLDATGYDPTRDHTEQTVADFVAEVQARGGRVAEEYQPAITALDELDGIRQSVDEYDGPRTMDNLEAASDIFDRYAAVIDVFFEAGTRITLEVDDSNLRSGAELVDVSTRQIEVIATLAHLALTNIELDSRDAVIEVAALVDEFARNATTIKLHDSDSYRNLVESSFPENFTADMIGTIDGALATGTVDVNALLALLNVEDDNDYPGFVDDATETLDREADRLVNGAERSQRIYLALAALTVLLTAAVSWLASRSITRPLQSLTRQAATMADQRLPKAVQDILDKKLGEDIALPRVAPVKVETRDEIADVAEALNTVQHAALGLAIEQTVLRRNIADSFVNLGRRNQNLLSRQLDFITELEQRATEPDVLADLFRLDHLATRMRRNAESLLVLADIETPRKWAAPVRMTDVIRAALGEVEQFQRVTVNALDPATVAGTAAADIAHLLAELIENALVFSALDHSVEIHGRRHPVAGDSGNLGSPGLDGPAEGARPPGYTLAIVDNGIGMSPDELARANRRLAGAESFTVAPSKYLGHYVAGNLAGRHSIRLELQGARRQGIVAMAHLPADVLAVDDAATSWPVRTQPLGGPQAPR
jgi:signal transduction histidine kinase